jgi:hypothetical protein
MDKPKDEAPAPDQPTPSALTRGWRLALFLWITSFAFLFTYEWLTAIFKVLFDFFSGRKAP